MTQLFNFFLREEGSRENERRTKVAMKPKGHFIKFCFFFCYCWYFSGGGAEREWEGYSLESVKFLFSSSS